jgi:hypothetical protein
VSDHRVLDPKQERATDVQPRISRAALAKWREHYAGAEEIVPPPGALLALRCLFGDELAFYPDRMNPGAALIFFAPWPDPDSDRPAGWCGLLGPDGNPARRAGVRQKTGTLFGGAQPRPRAVVEATPQPPAASAGTAQPLRCDACGARPADGVPVRAGGTHYRRLVHAAGVPGRESGPKLRSCGTWVQR